MELPGSRQITVIVACVPAGRQCFENFLFRCSTLIGFVQAGETM
jgi:hypothetical protein